VRSDPVRPSAAWSVAVDGRAGDAELGGDLGGGLLAHAGPVELATATALDPTTLAAISRTSPDPAAVATAAAEVARAFGISPAQALPRLLALAPARDDLALVQPYAAKLQAANAAIPPADLAYLQANGAKVQKAQADNPGQWQTWWWVTVGGQVLFVPFIFVMAGRWNPRRAREDTRKHDELVDRELAALAAQQT
jgi:MFS transporter, ACS family, D-galactonate transporter